MRRLAALAPCATGSPSLPVRQAQASGSLWKRFSISPWMAQPVLMAVA